MAKDFRVLLIPGWVCNPETTGWGPWLIQELQNLGAHVLTKPIPHSLKLFPQRRAALRMCQELVPDANEQTFIIAHSYGGLVACDYVSKLTNSIGGMILVSPLYRWVGINALPITLRLPNTDAIKRNCPKTYVIHALDDYLVPYVNGITLSTLVGGELITLDKRGHFAPRDNASTMPEVIDLFATMTCHLRK